MRHAGHGWTSALLVGAPLVMLWVGAERGGAQGPVTISIADSAGDLSSVREIVENYKKANPQRVKDVRSEEHTSELQSLMRISYAVFCLKKKKPTKKKRTERHKVIAHN